MRALALLAALATLAGAVACGESKEPPPVATSPLADSADNVLFGVRNVLTMRGVRQAELLSDTAFMFDEGNRILLRDVHLTFFTASTGAKNAVLTSRQGTYNTRLQQMQAQGDVVVVTEDGRRLTTEELRFSQAQNEISSDSAFVLTEPGRRLEGIGFRSDPEMTRMQCLRGCRGTAGAVALPTPGAPTAGPAARPATTDSGAPVRAGDRPGSFRLPEDE